MSAAVEEHLPVRPLTEADASALAIIDAAAVDFPWRESQFRHGLQSGEFGWGIDIAGTLAGFALCSLVLDEATLLNIAVDPAWQRRGIAWQLLRVALASCHARGACRMLLEVRESNANAIALYRRAGFVIDGVRRAYYPTQDGREDGLLMSVSLPACLHR